ncbi:MAG: hypothetical protein H6922_01215 [Pseudomonadaceae bacterium]|nr:hypothetical protein [Pseudomonadaceae bacterium]
MSAESQAHSKVQMGSDKGFGQVFAAVFAVVGLLPLLHGAPVRAWALVVAAIFLVLAYAAPHVLQPLNKLWFAFGLVLAKVISPIIMTLLYMVAIVPTALALRLAGKDPMERKADPAAPSYWISRKDSPVGSMRNQF